MKTLALILIAALMAACGSGGHHPDKVSDTIRHFHGDTSEPDTSDLTANLAALPVNDTNTFAQTRLEHLQHKPCDQCHQPNTQKQPKQAAHWDISLKHGSDDVMNCATCHDRHTNMTQLKTLTNQPVAFDKVYDLCSQCHFQQKNDWLGGSHGKRIETWAGKRVIANCTSCHNPHQPGFPKRLPAMAPGRINTRQGDAHQENP